MTPKDKALELYLKYDTYKSKHTTTDTVKECALIAVDEILKELSPLDNHPLGTYINPKIEYWLEVKIEIEKL